MMMVEVVRVVTEKFGMDVVVVVVVTVLDEQSENLD